ncbi:MAG TPA: F0F1 ATP synthase subunit A [Burkholderiales bacterium]|nr:F0F1 ATP synthase subunit A [Burkholderiales bacterium]
METSAILFRVGPFGVSTAVVTTWGIMLALALFSLLATRALGERPGKLQTVLEGVVLAIESSIAAVYPQRPRMLLPFVGTLWVFLVVANLVGIVPGLHSPTGDLSLTAALAILVFLSVHWYGVRAEGWRDYLRHYLSPSPLLFPFHVTSELSRTVALAVRLFGNMASLEMAALLVLLVAGFLVPVPILLLHVVEALVQAYIFGMLALVYIAGGIQSQQLTKERKESKS